MDRETSIEGAFWVLNTTNDIRTVQSCLHTIGTHKDYILSKKHHCRNLSIALAKLIEKYDIGNLVLEHASQSRQSQSQSPRFLHSACMYLSGFYGSLLMMAVFLYFRTVSTAA